MPVDDRAPRVPQRLLYTPGVVLLVAVAAALAWMAIGQAERPSVAVRFEYDGSADDARVAHGMAIEITRLLAQVDGLDVRAAAPASRYRAPRPNTYAFAVERRARLVLEGLILSENGGARHIHASLIDPARAAVVWSQSFPPGNNHLLAVNDAVVTATAKALGLPLRPGHRPYRDYPANLLLQASFLRARALQADGGDASRAEAVDLFGHITKQSPSFVPALAALATTLGGHLSTAGWPPLDGRVETAARAAFDADAHLAEANVAIGLLSARACQWARADAYFADAIRLDPSATAAHRDYVMSTLLPLGRPADAVKVLRDALASNPDSVEVQRTMTYVQLQNHEYGAALDTSRWVITHAPNLEFADPLHGRALYLSRHAEQALEWFSRDGNHWGHRGYVLARMGRRDEARALAEAHPGEPARQLLIYAGLNDVERAVEALQRTALANPWRALVWMGWPEIEPVIRRDPRAAALRTQLLRPADQGGCAIGRLQADAVSASRTPGV